MGKPDWEAEAARWSHQIEQVVGGVRAWRAAHPRATFREIAEAIDAELSPLRAQMLAETAATSPAARFTEESGEDRPGCGACGGQLIGRGRRRRRVTTRGDAPVELEREYGFSDGATVREFILAHPSLVPMLRDAKEELASRFGADANTVLTVIRDPDEDGAGTLYAFVQTTEDPDTAGDRLDRFNDEWWRFTIGSEAVPLHFALEYV